MNIIYMHAQDIGDFIEPYGYNVHTPNIARLASDGVLFRWAYGAAPTCSPSRAALLSGMSAHGCGMFGLAHRGFEMSDYDKQLVRFLNDAGYETVLAGIQYESMAEEDFTMLEGVVQYLREPKDRPFFLSFGLRNSHRDYPKSAADTNPDYLLPPPQVYDNAETRRDTAALITSLRTVDQCVGAVLDALEEAELSDETLFIFTTDHGLPFPGMKCTLYNGGIKLAHIIKGPGREAGGFATDALVSQIDIFPTVCDTLALEKPEWLEGFSMAPLLDGGSAAIRDELYAEVNCHAAYEPMRYIRTDRYKLIRHYCDKNIPSNTDESPSKTFMVEHGLLDEPKEQEQLFDLYLDPMEQVNRVHDDRYQDVYQDLGAKLNSWMRTTADPLLNGRIPKPEGAIVLKQEALSPREKNYV